ncbi:MAG: helix-turn-helix transcriptional regulator [Kluyvera sp.]
MRKDLNLILATLTASLDALKATLPANTEVVLHDLTQPKSSVVGIINGHVSGRQVGDGLLSGPEEDDGFLGLIEERQEPLSSRVYSGYNSYTRGGKPLSSASTLYYDKQGKAIAAFCINVDMDPVIRFRRELDYLVSGMSATQTPTPEVRSLPEQSIKELLARFEAEPSETPKAFRLRVVTELHAMGIFKIKGSVNEIAHALGVTRYTIYNYLDQINGQ